MLYDLGSLTSLDVSDGPGVGLSDSLGVERGFSMLSVRLNSSFGLLIAAAGLMSCGTADENTDGGHRPGVSVEVALSGECPNGGVVINQGIDRNENGRIDPDEVTSSETVCHGVDGASCSVEENGDGTKTISCEDGTTAVVSDGADGAEGVDGADGVGLGVEVSEEAPGANCPAGGKKYVAFTDSNDNGIRDVGEPVLDTSYICNGQSFSEETTTILAAVVPKAQYAVLNIGCTDGSSIWHGTGTKTFTNAILTARHVMEGATNCGYYLGPTLVAGGGSPVYSALERDIAFIMDPTTYDGWADMEPIQVYTDSSFYIGDILLLVSHPKDLVSDRQYTFGLVTDNNVNASLSGLIATRWDDAFMTDMAATSGSSGGPIFNEAGHLVAIHVGGYTTEGLELNYSLPIKTADFW